MPSPILELTQLTHLPSSTPLLPTLQTARTLIKTHIHSTRSHFYRSFQTPTEIYILGFWPSIQEHHDFLKSEKREVCLGGQEGVLGFVRGVHVDVGLGEGRGGLDLDGVAYLGIGKGGMGGLEGVERGVREVGGGEAGFWCLRREVLDGEGGEGVLIFGWRDELLVGEFERVVGRLRGEMEGNGKVEVVLLKDMEK